ncbi:MAG TPA: GNAT family N-acetyltransferase [Candidatus Ruthenibacterium merdavium]|uniref:GNAT family N-acetyltransferase n=1 Tax=Candidatus Ruthenibacterium merdavium TaxID=2838752 RepID=A0A9D2TJ74_9FIRM|nr:GNAT family N-acetyltransferase [Candidatus Ruthenibacterium merdavium]
MVRFARKEDYEAINALRAPVCALHSNGYPALFKPVFAKDHQERVLKMMEDPEQDVLVAEENGQLLGFAMVEYIKREETNSIYAVHEAHIVEIGVDETSQGKGIGTALIQAVKDAAKVRECRSVQLDVWEFNKSALRFYEKLGFVTLRRKMEQVLDET